MFLLPRNQIPQAPEELEQAIEDGLRALLSRPQKMTIVRGANTSALDSIGVDLSGAEIHHHHRPPPLDGEGAVPAMLVRHIHIAGEPIKILGSGFSFRFEASDVEIHQKLQADGKLLLSLHRAQDGNVRFEISRSAVETIVMNAAAEVAEKQGVKIDNAQLELTQHGPRAVDGKLRVSAHKFIFHPVLTLAGTLGINEQFVAKVSNLQCHGEGPIASLACAAINPTFSRIAQRTFPLSALPLSDIQLRNLALDTDGDKLVVRARFGPR